MIRGGIDKDMKNKDLIFDRSCHVLYSKACEKEIKKKIALHYAAELQEFGQKYNSDTLSI